MINRELRKTWHRRRAWRSAAATLQAFRRARWAARSALDCCPGVPGTFLHPERKCFRILFSDTACFGNRIMFLAFCVWNGAEIVTDWEIRWSGPVNDAGRGRWMTLGRAGRKCRKKVFNGVCKSLRNVDLTYHIPRRKSLKYFAKHDAISRFFTIFAIPKTGF